MAEGWIRHDMGVRVDVSSAGTMPCFVHPLAIRVMQEVGVDITGHRSKSVREFLDQPFDLVVTVCDHAREVCPNLPGAGKYAHESIGDPVIYGTEGDLALRKFRETRDLIRERIVDLVRRNLFESEKGKF